jgi:hypothetical protein
MAMRPQYGDPGCASCRFIDHFSGADWYYCPGGAVPKLVARQSVDPHDILLRTLTEKPKAGVWKRAWDLAQERGVVTP